MRTTITIVIAGLDPAIHGWACAGAAMDARVKPAHDNERNGRRTSGTGGK